MNSIIQFKLSTGEEIIADVLSYPTDDIHMFAVKSAMKIVLTQSTDDLYMYVFRPWLIMQNDMNTVNLLNPDLIIGQTYPNRQLTEQWCNAVLRMIESKEILDSMDNMDSDINITHMTDPVIIN